jgi:ubiquinone/menaquinone biosynthesis C-methylase UbiE
MDLPFPDAAFDVAVMALVIFFVPDPAKGVAEMVRVVRPGGTVGAYAWDVLGGGLPVDVIQDELRGFGMTPPLPPRADASRLEAMQAAWTSAGIEAVETREIAVQRTFADFDDFWTSSQTASVGPMIAAMTTGDVEQLKARLRARLPADASGRITYGARANAVKGRVAG